MSIAHNVKSRRLEMGLSQDELARLVGYKSRSAIAKIESGDNDITVSKLVKLAKAMDTTAESLISGVTIDRDAVLPYARRGASRKNVAIILAGGKSSRNSQNIPSQFITVLGKAVIMYCLEVYQAHSSIDEIYVVCADEWRGIVQTQSLESGITKLQGTVPSGKSGILSVLNAVRMMEGCGCRRNDLVVLQEATRPFVSMELVTKLLSECRKGDGAVAAQRRDDKIQFLRHDGGLEYLDRNEVVELQSPEAYPLGSLLDLFSKAFERNHPMTETCIAMLMFNLGFHLRFCETTGNNLKLVRQEDLAVFTALLHQRELG